MLCWDCPSNVVVGIVEAGKFWDCKAMGRWIAKEMSGLPRAVIVEYSNC